MAHQEGRRYLVTVVQQARLLIDVQIQRPQHAGHAAFAQPPLGDIGKGFEYTGVVRSLDHAEKTLARVVMLEVQRVDLRADAPHRDAIPACDPALPVEVFEHGFLR